MAAPARPMRADARRNRDAVLDAGAELLAHRPQATMQELADASGLGRATVYRHFPAREDLLGALQSRIAEEVTEAVALSLTAAGDGAEAVLRRLVVEASALGQRWRFMAAVTGRGEDPGLDPAVAAAFERWVADAQARGELEGSDPGWVSSALRGLIEAGHDTYADDPEAAARVVSDAVVRLFVRP